MERAIVGTDPHKLTVTLAVVDVLGVKVAAGSFANTEAGLSDALAWLRRLNVELVRVGVEGSSGHGRHLAGRLVDAGFDTREVPPRRTAERRRARRRAKSDHEDALAIARATAGEPDLGPVKPGSGLGPVHDELVTVRGHRDLLVSRRTMLLNHAEATLAALPRQLADGLPRGRAVPPRLAAAVQLDTSTATPAVRAQIRLLVELSDDIAVISERVKTLEKRLAELVRACGPTLTQEAGIGVVAAAALLAEVGDPARFRSESAFNRWWGGAPVAVSSGEGDTEPTRHRLDLLGNRAVNCVLHMMSVTQARCHEPAQEYLVS